MFGAIVGATIKNVTFNSTNVLNESGVSLLAKSMDDSNILNVTFNFPVLSGSTDIVDNASFGVLVCGRVWRNMFRNVTVNSDGDLGSLLSPNAGYIGGSDYNYFFDFVVNAKSLTAMAYRPVSGRIFVAGNGAADGETQDKITYGSTEYTIWKIRHVTLNVKA